MDTCLPNHGRSRISSQAVHMHSSWLHCTAGPQTTNRLRNKSSSYSQTSSTMVRLRMRTYPIRHRSCPVRLLVAARLTSPQRVCFEHEHDRMHRSCRCSSRVVCRSSWRSLPHACLQLSSGGLSAYRCSTAHHSQSEVD